ncbi:hypothetical protein B0H13DRAFT_515815 [Mycena leptocephala]|nr:hypothetical protein B0H13DRAFT_515815 [Mycena leptocephala]
MTSTTSLRGSYMPYDISTNRWYTATQLIGYLQRLADQTPEGDPRQRDYLTELSGVFERRYRETGNLQDLEAAVQAIEKALSFFSADRDSAGSLTTQHERVPPVETAQDAVSLTPADQSDRPARLQRLSQILAYRYRILKDPNDMERSIRSGQEAIELTPMDDFLRASRLQHLALCFQIKYREERTDPKDLQAMHQLYGASFQTQGPPQNPEESWRAALCWAEFSLEFQDIHLLDAYLAAFQLLPDILWIGHPSHIREDTLRKLGLADATSRATRACIGASNFTAAIELLEQGIGTIFQQILQVKPDRRELPPAHARKLQELSSKLDSHTYDGPTDLYRQRKELLEDIRSQPGLEDFLRPKPYKALSHASQGGPVIILSSHTDGSDVFIILNPTSDPVHLKFSNVSSHELTAQRKLLMDVLGRCNVRRRGDSTSTRLYAYQEGFMSKTTDQCFAELLAWLWMNVVNPVYEALKSAVVATYQGIFRTAAACMFSRNSVHPFIHRNISISPGCLYKEAIQQSAKTDCCCSNTHRSRRNQSSQRGRARSPENPFSGVQSPMPGRGTSNPGGCSAPAAGLLLGTFSLSRKARFERTKYKPSPPLRRQPGAT